MKEDTTLNLRRWFMAFTLQGASLGAFTLILSLFTVTGMKGNVENASVVVALYSLGNLVGSVITGIVLDKARDYPAIIFRSLFLSAIIAIVLPFSYSLSIYSLLSFLMGLSVAFVGPAIIVFMNKRLPEKMYRRSLSALNLLNSTGATLGTFIGSALLVSFSFMEETSRMALIFFFSSVLFAIASIMISTQRKGSLHILGDRSSDRLNVSKFPEAIIDVIDINKYEQRSRTFILAAMLTFFGANMMLAVFSIYLKEYLNVSSTLIFMIYGINSIAGNVGFYLANTVMRRVNDKELIKAVVITRAILIVFITISGIFKNIGYLKMLTFVSFTLFGFTWPFFYLPLTVQATNIEGMEKSGKILGLLNASTNLAVIVASFISGLIAQRINYFTAFVIGVLFLIAAYRMFQRY